MTTKDQLRTYVPPLLALAGAGLLLSVAIGKTRFSSLAAVTGRQGLQRGTSREGAPPEARQSCSDRFASDTHDCVKYRDEGYNKCGEYRDNGYNQCSEYRDEGYNSCQRWDQNCCDWWPCSWGCHLISWVCTAWYWISNVVCVAWYWVSNVVCVAWYWVSNVVCVLWAWIKVFPLFCFACVILTGLLKFLGIFTGKPAPALRDGHDAKHRIEQQDYNTYPNLGAFDRWISWLTTPCFKEYGIQGWTDLNREICAYGVVLQAADNSDGLFTVDLAIDEAGSLTVTDPGGDPFDGIRKSPPSYIRAEIFPQVRAGMAPTDYPVRGHYAKICGELFWDGDGFFEIHPRAATDIVAH